MKYLAIVLALVAVSVAAAQEPPKLVPVTVTVYLTVPQLAAVTGLNPGVEPAAVVGAHLTPIAQGWANGLVNDLVRIAIDAEMADKAEQKPIFDAIVARLDSVKADAEAAAKPVEEPKE